MVGCRRAARVRDGDLAKPWTRPVVWERFLLSQDYQVTPSKLQPQAAVVSQGEVTFSAGVTLFGVTTGSQFPSLVSAVSSSSVLDGVRGRVRGRLPGSPKA